MTTLSQSINILAAQIGATANIKNAETDAALAGKAAIGHGHAIADVTGLQAALDSKSATTHNHDSAYQPLDQQLTDLAALTYGGNGSKLLRVNSAATGFELISPPSFAIADISGLVSALAAKAPLADPTFTGTLTASTITSPTITTLQSNIDAKAAISHTHATSDVTGLTAALAGKADTSHNHDSAYQPLDQQLTDLAALAYTSNGSKVVRVNAGATAFELVALASVAISGSAADLTGTLAAARLPALSGDITSSAGSAATTLATVNSNIGSFGSASLVPVITVNAKGLITAVSTAAVAGGGGSASTVTFTPSGDIAATNVQAAIAELDSEKAAISHSHSIANVTGLQAAIDAKKALISSINARTANYTVDSTDSSKTVTMSSASALTLTVPTNATTAIPIGTSIDVVQLGAGQVTIAGSGVTFRSSAGLKFRTQYSAASLLKIGTDEWLVAGDLST